METTIPSNKRKLTRSPTPASLPYFLLDGDDSFEDHTQSSPSFSLTSSSATSSITLVDTSQETAPSMPILASPEYFGDDEEDPQEGHSLKKRRINMGQQKRVRFDSSQDRVYHYHQNWAIIGSEPDASLTQPSIPSSMDFRTTPSDRGHPPHVLDMSPKQPSPPWSIEPRGLWSPPRLRPSFSDISAQRSTEPLLSTPPLLRRERSVPISVSESSTIPLEQSTALNGPISSAPDTPPLDISIGASSPSLSDEDLTPSPQDHDNHAEQPLSVIMARVSRVRLMSPPTLNHHGRSSTGKERFSPYERPRPSSVPSDSPTVPSTPSIPSTSTSLPSLETVDSSLATCSVNPAAARPPPRFARSKSFSIESKAPPMLRREASTPLLLGD